MRNIILTSNERWIRVVQRQHIGGEGTFRDVKLLVPKLAEETGYFSARTCLPQDR